MAICCVCNFEIKENEFSEDCNFCGRDICEKCWDKEQPSETLIYGWVCRECEKE